MRLDRLDAELGITDVIEGEAPGADQLEEGHPDIVIAFPGGRGTANMVAQARKAGVRVVEVSEKE